jgi:diguanylate cyclase (GGDEF)-like protein
MISLRKHIDNYRENGGETSQGKSDIPEPVLSEFRAILLAIGRCADRAVPSLGIELIPKMTCLRQTLVPPVSPELLSQTNRQAQAELSQWTDHALARHQDVERELREVISAVSAAAGSLSDRDAKYVREIGHLTGRLSTIAEGNDLAHMRRSIVESTRALKDCVARMAEDSKASVAHLTSEVNQYRARLEEAERVSETDLLTNLANRRALEKHLDARVAACQSFCLIMIDLNDFKLVNDHLGHLAGDDLLKQFAGELKSQFTPAEMVGRWGGDEFVVVVAGHLDDAQAGAGRVRKWSLGEYKIKQGDRCVKTLVKAAIGVAEWDGRETGLQLLARADQEVYRNKEPGQRARSISSESSPTPVK